MEVINVAELNADFYDGARGFAAETGGYTFVDANRAERAVRQIWQAAGHYYLLGYDASAPGRSRWTVFPRPGTHAIHVRVHRPGVTVRANSARA